jgi:hypothetical protein
MDIYATGYLNRVVERVRPIPTFFLDLFFPEVVLSDKEEIYFDSVEGKPRLAPFVHPLREGKLVEDEGYTTKSFKPAYIKDLRILNPLKAIKRRAGEAIGGELSLAERASLNLTASIQNQRDILTRRLEVMAAEAIRSARQTIVGEGVNATVVFGRDSALTVTLTTTAKWDDAANTSQSNSFEDWSALLLDKSGYGGTDIIMDAKAWKLLKKDASFAKLLDRNYKGGDGTTLDMNPRAKVEGVQFKGVLGDFFVWVYNHPYTDDSGAAANIMPDNTVIMADRRGVEGVRHYGAIMDLDNLRPAEQFVKSWTKEDPSARLLLSQSSPLMVPYRYNATLVATVA